MQIFKKHTQMNKLELEIKIELTKAITRKEVECLQDAFDFVAGLTNEAWDRSFVNKVYTLNQK